MELSCHQQSYSFTSIATSDIFLILHFPAPVISSGIRTGPWWEAVQGTVALWIPLEVWHGISTTEINEQFQQFVIYIKRVFSVRSWPSAGPFKRGEMLTRIWHATQHSKKKLYTSYSANKTKRYTTSLARRIRLKITQWPLRPLAQITIKNVLRPGMKDLYINGI